jgi:hypothetical protein
VTPNGILSTFACALVIFSILCTIRQVRYVRGSRQRYIWASIARTAGLAVAGLYLVKGITNIISHDYWLAAFDFGVALLWSWEFDNNKDNWWSGRGKKIRSAVKRRLNARAPQPSTPT